MEEGMDLWQVLEERSTLRSFASRPVSSEIVRKAVRAALRAPAYNHLWEWAFLRIEDPGFRVRLAEAFEIRDVDDPATLHALFSPCPRRLDRSTFAPFPCSGRCSCQLPSSSCPPIDPSVSRPRQGIPLT